MRFQNLALRGKASDIEISEFTEKALEEKLKKKGKTK